MGIAQTTTITCDDCSETLGEGMNFFYFQVQAIGEIAPPFANLLAFCGTNCLQKWSANLSAPTA
jgi:hypothetical protein